MVENVVYNRKTIDEAIETAQRDIQAMCDDMYETERNLGIRE